MSMLGALGMGLMIGEGINNVVLKYSKNNYQEKIDRLRACVTDLKKHYDNLSSLKSRLRNIWNDSQAEEYHKEIEQAMKYCDNQQKMVEEQILRWEAAIKEMEDVYASTSEQLGTIKGIIDALNIID